ncbi:MAG: peptidylprolyl isomerase, partial [Bacteroidota bacterium]
AAYGFTRAPAEAWRGQAVALRAAFDAGAGDASRMHLARALDRLDDGQDVPRLVEALASEPDWRTRVQIARALRGVDDISARGALARAVDDPSPHVAQTAAAAFADPEAASTDDLSVALDRLRDNDLAWTTQAELLPLVARSGRADAVLAWADAHPDRFAQAAALRALGHADDGAALTRLFTCARADDTLLATAALQGLVTQWETGDYGARRFFETFVHGLERRDLATTSITAPVLADSAFWAMGTAERMRTVYGQLSAPNDIAPMSAIIRALGQVRDGAEVDFLLGVALEGPPALREVARDALNDRLVDGVEVDVSGSGTNGTTSIDWTHLAQVGRAPRLVLDTDRGRIVIEMDTEAAPQTVQLLTRTAAGGRYDGVPFHRVVSNFVIQGGDYFRRDGYGGPETPIRSEFTRLRYTAGTAGMASSGKDTEGVQYFVTHSPQPHLDGRYTAFGRVVEGTDVVDRILQGDLVRRARVLPDRSGR